MNVIRFSFVYAYNYICYAGICVGFLVLAKWLTGIQDHILHQSTDGLQRYLQSYL